MNLIELAQELNLSPQRTASTNGGEYHSACPNCQGRDRFIIWDKIGRYFCRQCESKGDAIQFCRDFLGLDYRSACEKVGEQPKDFSSHRTRAFKKEFLPRPTSTPSDGWRNRATAFTLESHQFALNNPEAKHALIERGFTMDAIETFVLGWNPINRFDASNLWDISSSTEKQKIWLPKGIVIPSFINNLLVKLKIRRSDWNPHEHLPKYVEVSGSMKAPSFYGSPQNLPILIVEAELDGLLTQQIGADLINCVALGGVSKKPDVYVDQLLRQSPIILFSLDYDDPGKKAYRFWKSTYPHIKPWPVPRGKSPGDAFKEGVNLRHWLEMGIK